MSRRKVPPLGIERTLTNREAVHFRDDLKQARSAVLADNEAYAVVMTAIERLARFLNPKATNLGKAKDVLRELANASSLVDRRASPTEGLDRFAALFESLTVARNDAMHVGARARHLTTHAVDICLYLEDALQSTLRSVSEFMVKSPITVERWQPLSYVRQQMLEHSFTYLPVVPEDGQVWELISDYSLAQYLRVEWNERKGRLSESLGIAVERGLRTRRANTVATDSDVKDLLGEMDERPHLVLTADGRLAGLVTAFDLL